MRDHRKKKNAGALQWMPPANDGSHEDANCASFFLQAAVESDLVCPVLFRLYSWLPWQLFDVGSKKFLHSSTLLQFADRANEQRQSNLQFICLYRFEEYFYHSYANIVG